ncbi:MAG: zinc ribbon domain-containing protein [Melioribacteraceae bacterium]|nr:zinc ribbon domain-containing protein [Melioribacteraceae bacterium]
MPTYDYKCLDCENRFEYFQSIIDEPLSICPNCGGTVKRLIGAGAGPIFKGSGFYQTDYKSNGSSSKSSKTSSDKKE